MSRRRPWLRIDADADQHPRVAELRAGLRREQADSACWAWMRLLMALKRSGEDAFRSEAHLQHALGEDYRWVERLRKVGLLEGLSIRDWEAYQRPDPNSSLRTRAYRERLTLASEAGVKRSETPVKRPDGDGDVDGDGYMDKKKEIVRKPALAYQPVTGNGPTHIGAILRGRRA